MGFIPVETPGFTTRPYEGISYNYPRIYMLGEVFVQALSNVLGFPMSRRFFSRLSILGAVSLVGGLGMGGLAGRIGFLRRRYADAFLSAPFDALPFIS
jgi:hypothetical protein